MSSVPVGFWSQLMSVLFTDTSIELLAKQCCNVHTGITYIHTCITVYHSKLHEYCSYGSGYPWILLLLRVDTFVWNNVCSYA